MSILTHAQPDIASLDVEIAALGANLTALQDMARSLPVGITVPLDKHAEFCQMVDFVDSLFERVVVMMESAGIEPEAVLS